MESKTREDEDKRFLTYTQHTRFKVKSTTPP